MLKPSSNFSTDRLKAVPYLWSLFAICVSCLSLSNCLVYSLQPCGHQLRKDWPLGSLVCDVFFLFLSLARIMP